MMKFFLVLTSVFLFFFFFDILDAQQNSTVRFVKQCYGQLCPQNTSYCLKIVNTTADDQNVITEVDCLDSNFTVTSRFNHSRVNIFGPVLSFEGVSLSTASEVPALM